MQQRVLLAAVDGEVVVAALASIHKLQIDVLPDALEITVVPRLEGEGGGFAAAFFHRPLVAAAGGMRVNGVGRAPGDVNPPAVRLPAGLAGRIVLVGVGDATIVLFAEFVLRRILVGVATQPEVLDESVALLVVAERPERLALLVGNDVAHILLQPRLVGPLQFLAYRLLSGKLRLVGALSLERINFLILLVGRLRLG